MSFSKISNYDAITAMQSGQGLECSRSRDDQDALLQKAFSTQMKMAQSLFGEGSQRYGEGSSPGSFDSSLINDSMMFEALTTITRLMRDESKLSRQVDRSQVGVSGRQQDAAA